MAPWRCAPRVIWVVGCLGGEARQQYAKPLAVSTTNAQMHEMQLCVALASKAFQNLLQVNAQMSQLQQMGALRGALSISKPEIAVV